MGGSHPQWVGLFPNKMTMTFYILLVSLLCIMFFYEQNFINYIGIILERISGLSIFKDYHRKDINLKSLVGYYSSLHHQFSMWLSSFCSLLLPYFVYPAIQPHEPSHSMVCLCCSLCWRCLSNSSLMTNLLFSFRIHYKFQYFCEIFSLSIRGCLVIYMLWASIPVYVSLSSR